MYNHLLYLSYWIANAAVFYLFSTLAGSEVILGNWRFDSLEASIYAGFWLTILIWFWWDFAVAKHFRFDKPLYTVGFFLLANFASILIVSKFSYLTGFSLTKDYWAFGMAAAAVVSQKVAWKLVVKA